MYLLLKTMLMFSDDVIKPYGALPTQLQIDYQRIELEAFAHFGMNTFTNVEWGTGKEDEKLYNPTEFDPEQWVKSLVKTGWKKLIFTAKHHDGFSQWPSDYTNHTTSSSSWRNGQGDPVREVMEACHKYGLQAAIYLSPWDMNSPYYGQGLAYNEYYYRTMDELYSRYGELVEVWMDGAKGSGVEQNYEFDDWFRGIKERQPHTIIWSQIGPDARWSGNEAGNAGDTTWSTINNTKMRTEPEDPKYLNKGEENGPDWIVSEADVSIRPGWFYHSDQDSKVKGGRELFNLYLSSVGKNSLLLLNIPPSQAGLFHENDVAALEDFQRIRDNTFGFDLADGAEVEADTEADPEFAASNVVDGNEETYWAPEGQKGVVTVTFPEAVEFDLVQLREFIQLGQRVKSFKVHAEVDGKWSEVAAATTIGNKRIVKLNKAVTATGLRVDILESLATPLICGLSVFKVDEE